MAATKRRGKPSPKIKLVKHGACERVEIMPRVGGQYTNAIGWVCGVEGGGYDFSTLGQGKPGEYVALKPRKKTKASAVLTVIKNYQSWIGGLRHGKLHY